MKLYMAGPMFKEADITYNLKLAREIRSIGLTVYCPNENQTINEKSDIRIDGRMIYEADMTELISSNILLLNISTDAGAIWEAGYFDCLSRNVNSEKHLGVIGLCTDMRLSAPVDDRKSKIHNQVYYVNQLIVGAMDTSLGIYYERKALYKALERINRKEAER